MEGLRFNKGKQRWDLVHPKAEEGLVRVLTKGAEKYAPRNWELGMPWSKVIASLKRHLHAVEAGEDFDEETGLLHIDHLQCNAHFLSAYYHDRPEFDDRAHSYLAPHAIALDIDGVLADFCSKINEKLERDLGHHHFEFHYFPDEFWKDMANDNEFWLSLPPLLPGEALPFTPLGYVTNRPVPSAISEQWLERNNFPCKPVITVGKGSKVEAIKKLGAKFFVEDKFENFAEINAAGICCYLLDQPYNRRYNVGYKRIYNLDQVGKINYR